MAIKRQEWLINCNICTTICKMLTIGEAMKGYGSSLYYFRNFSQFFHTSQKTSELKSNKQLKLFVCFKVRSLCFCFLAMLPSFRDLSFPTKGWIQAEAVTNQVLTTGPPGKSPPFKSGLVLATHVMPGTALHKPSPNSPNILHSNSGVSATGLLIWKWRKGVWRVKELF